MKTLASSTFLNYVLLPKKNAVRIFLLLYEVVNWPSAVCFLWYSLHLYSTTDHIPLRVNLAFFFPSVGHSLPRDRVGSDMTHCAYSRNERRLTWHPPATGVTRQLTRCRNDFRASDINVISDDKMDCIQSIMFHQILMYAYVFSFYWILLRTTVQTAMVPPFADGFPRESHALNVALITWEYRSVWSLRVSVHFIALRY